jgi:membrane protease subunit HflK
MPWNDNANPGPWGSPSPGEGDKDGRGEGRGRGPGGPRRPDGPQVPPQLNEILRRLRAMFGGAGGGPGGGLRSGAVAAILAAGFAIWTLSGIYVVQPNEQALVTTFGSFSRKEGPGLRYHLPSPIERVEKVAVTTLNKTDVGGSAGADAPEEALMLTGDENIVDLNFSVTWRVSDAPRYVFDLREPDDAVKAVAESAMREVVGKTDLQAIQTNGRGQLQLQAAELMQKTLDRWGAGVTVVEVQVRSANPPPEVVPAAREVLNAKQEADSKVNEANTYSNRVVNEAKGDASRITQSAEAYGEQATRTAKGDAARFNQIYGEYRRAPEVTRQRLYIETMQRVLARSNKVVVDGKGTSAPIILPPDVFKPRAAAPAAIAGPGEGQPTVTPDPSAGAAK